MSRSILSSPLVRAFLVGSRLFEYKATVSQSGIFGLGNFGLEKIVIAC